MPVTINITENANQVDVKVEGDLDQVSLKKDFWLMLSSSQQQTIENSQKLNFCLNAVSHVDTAGLAWTINSLADFSKRSVAVDIKNMPEKLLNLAKLSNAEGLLNGK
jgi:phospholipid transport system transporter-binding protein